MKKLKSHRIIYKLIYYIKDKEFIDKLKGRFNSANYNGH